MVLADCREGIGSDSYTQVMMNWSHRWREFLEHISQSPQVRKDQWQAQMHCRVLERISQQRLWMATDGLPPQIWNNAGLRRWEETGLPRSDYSRRGPLLARAPARRWQ